MPWQSVVDYKASQTTASAQSKPASAKPNPGTPPAEPAAAPSATQPAASASPSADPTPQGAIDRCLGAYRRTLTATKNRDQAAEAFKNALPFLTSRASIHEFLACITYGMVLRIFWQDEGPRLIAAARTTLAALPREPALHFGIAPGRPRKQAEMSN